MAGVIWHSVSLTGFGPYAEKVTYTFPADFGVLVAPNESGKSTLVAGLMATLYGLPASSSPDDFGQARYRHLGRAPGFEGEVEFTATDGLRYHVWRDFERHQVVVTRLGPEGPERIHQGVHNPGARRGNQEYEQLIARLVGLPSRELLEATFCVTQPLPEMGQVDQSVQELLAGAGGGRPQEAMAWLEEEARKRTRYPADYGIPTTLRKDRELEEVQAEIRNLAAAIEQARSAVDSYHQSAGRLQEVEALLRETQQEAGRRRQVLDALQEWQRLAERRQQHLRQVSSLQRTLDGARKVAERLHEARARLARDWPELADLPADTGDRLQELIGLEESLARLASDRANLARQRSSCEQAAQEAEARLQSDFGDVAGRPALSRDVRELQAKVADLKRLEAELAELAAEEERLAARLSALPDWGQLGRPADEAVRRLRTAADEALQRWERYERLRAKVRETAASLERYAVFAGQPPEVLEQVRRFHVLEAEARRRAEVAAARAEDLDRQLKRVEAEAERLRTEYAAVAGLDERVVAAAREKVALLEQQDRARADLAEAQREAGAARARSRGVAAAVGLLLGFGIGWLLGRALMGGAGVPAAVTPAVGPVLAVAAVLAALLALVGWILGGRLAGGEAARRVRTLEQQVRELSARIGALDLGPLAAEPPLRLNLLAQQWEEWRRRSEALEEERRSLTGSTQAAELRAAYEQAQRELEALEAQLRPFTAQFADPAAALAEWETLQRDLQRDQEDLAELCRAEWGLALEAGFGVPTQAGRGVPTQTENAVPAETGHGVPTQAQHGVPALSLSDLSGRWAELARLAQLAAAAGMAPVMAPGMEPAGDLAGAGARTLGDLVRWLRAATPSWWAQVTAAAGEWTAADRRLAEVQTERRRLTEPEADGRTHIERLREEVEALRQRVAPFSEQSDPDELEARVSAAAKLKEQADQERAKAKTLQEQERQVAERHSETARQADALRSELAPALGAANGDVRAALERWRAREQARRQAQELGKELSGILTASGVATLEELDARLTAAQLEWGRATDSLEALVRAHPGLPPVDEADDPLRVQSRIEALREEQRGLQARLQQLEEERRTLRDQLQDLGRDTINVAEAEMRLAELRQREQALVREIRALGIAYQELREAVRVYRATYRERLEAAATEYWAGLTGRTGRRVRLSDQFAVSVVEPDGTVLSPAQLSKGAQDQLYLALRLAIGDLIAEEVRLPFVFDDPFLNCDEERLTYIRAALSRLAEERQVLLLSHRADFAAWGSPVVAG